MSNYYRVKAYFEKENINAVFDSHGCFEKLWQFSAFIVEKGGTILDVQKDEQMTDTYTRVEESAKDIFERGGVTGKVNSNTGRRCAFPCAFAGFSFTYSF